MHSTGSWYVFRRRVLEPGDIILSTVPASLLSRFICGATGAAFSHAGILVDPRLLVEARGFGVARVSIARLSVRSLSSVRVLRLRPGTSSGTSDAPRRAAEWAESKVGSPYSLKGALLALLEKVRVQDRDSFFCSHLVAEAYRFAGIELFPGVALEPEKTVPGDFATSPLLSDVTEAVAHLESIDPAYARQAIEDGPSWSPHQEEVKKYQELVKRVGREFIAHGLEPPVDFGTLLLSLKRVHGRVAHALDDACLKALEELRFADLLALDAEGQYWASRYDDVVREGIEIGALSRPEVARQLGQWRVRLAGLESDCQRDTLMLAALSEAFHSSQCETFRFLYAVFQTAAHRRSEVTAALRRAVTLAERFAEAGGDRES